MFDAMGNHLKAEDPVCWAAALNGTLTLRFGTIKAVTTSYVTIQPAGLGDRVVHRVRKLERVLKLSRRDWLKNAA